MYITIYVVLSHVGFATIYVFEYSFVPFVAYVKIAHEMDPKKYLNIVGCSRIEQTNIRIYLDAKELIERISKYILIKEKPGLQILIIFVSQLFRIFKYSSSCAHH